VAGPAAWKACAIAVDVFGRHGGSDPFADEAAHPMIIAES
jgi:hypothetical protein